MNHCTLWPDRLGSLDWSACCRAHDLAYDAGVNRLAADLELARCVAGVSPFMAAVMFAGVAAFGWLFYRRKR